MGPLRREEHISAGYKLQHMGLCLPGTGKTDNLPTLSPLFGTCQPCTCTSRYRGCFAEYTKIVNHAFAQVQPSLVASIQQQGQSLKNPVRVRLAFVIVPCPQKHISAALCAPVLSHADPSVPVMLRPGVPTSLPHKLLSAPNRIMTLGSHVVALS